MSINIFKKDREYSRFDLAILFLVIFIVVSFSSRVALFINTYSLMDSSILSILKIFSIGLFYDIVAGLYYIIPLSIYLILIPINLFNSKFHKIFMLVYFFFQVYGIVFNNFSEWFFWEEFGKRFNFIAVDYLVYTHEVIQNIIESYPMPLLLGTIFVISLIIFVLAFKFTNVFSSSFEDESGFLFRLKYGTVLLLLTVLFFNILDKQNLSNISKNQFNNELAKNGFYSLFSAFRNNTLEYKEFYKTIDDKIVFARLKDKVGFDDKTRLEISNNTQERKHNIMFIMVESLSAKYMGVYGNDEHITPYLDKLTSKSLFFDNLYATGTRTVRGMEAVTLSVPPTPGRGIIKRPDNHNTNSIGDVFQEKGYDSKFIYAGHGYFDNMNDFFSHHKFQIVDRESFTKEEITFSNVWGVCDGDLLNKAISEADKSYKNNKPFFSFIMTTSNHRPYTYPSGKIDIPSHTGRNGAVKYTDFAINEFIEKSKDKPWFDNTIFVIIADHNGGSSGKAKLPLYRYKIPLIIYAPKLIDPEVVHKLSSQMDTMPTIFGMFNWNYKSRFYGKNILDDSFRQRALIGNYQRLGLVEDDELIILNADKSVDSFKILEKGLYNTKYEANKIDNEKELDAIMYYQSASYLYEHKDELYEK